MFALWVSVLYCAESPTLQPTEPEANICLQEGILLIGSLRAKARPGRRKSVGRDFIAHYRGCVAGTHFLYLSFNSTRFRCNLKFLREVAPSHGKKEE